MKNLKISKSDLIEAESNGCSNAEQYWNYLNGIKKTKSNDIEILSLLFVCFGLLILFIHAINQNNLIIELVSLSGFMATGYYIYHREATREILKNIKELIVLPTSAIVFIYILKLTYGTVDNIPPLIRVDILIYLLMITVSAICYFRNKNHLILSALFLFCLMFVESFFIIKHQENILIPLAVTYNIPNLEDKIGFVSSIITLFAVTFYLKNNILSLKYVSVLTTLYYMSEMLVYQYKYIMVIIPICLLFINAYKFKFKENDNDFDKFLIIISLVCILAYNFFKLGNIFNLIFLLILFVFAFKNGFNKLLILITFIIAIFTENLMDIDDVLFKIIYYIVFGVLIFINNRLNKKYKFLN